jgi:hypothetical protein
VVAGGPDRHRQRVHCVAPGCLTPPAHVDCHTPRTQLEVLQSRLLDAGSAIATPTDASSAAKLARVAFPSEATAQLEVRGVVRGGCAAPAALVSDARGCCKHAHS